MFYFATVLLEHFSAAKHPFITKEEEYLTVKRQKM